MKKAEILFLLLLALAFIFYLPVLRLYFVADDFYYLSFSSLKETFTIHPGLYHYIPVFWLVLYTVNAATGKNPAVLHFLALVIHLINIFLVYKLAGTLIKKETVSLFAAALFAFYFANYEAVFWITGTSISMMVLFYLTGLMFYIRYTESNNIKDYLLFFGAFIFSIFSHEYALSLPVACAFYFFQAGRNGKSKRDGKLLILPFIFIFAAFIFKIYFSAAPLAVTTPTIARVFMSVIKSSLYLFFPVPQIIDKLPKIILPLLFLLISGSLYLLSRKNKKRIFLLIWTLVSITIFSITSLPQARYFYLSFVPVSILISEIVFTFYEKKKSGFLIFIYPVIIILAGVMFLWFQMNLWLENSRIIKNSIQTVKNNDNGKSEIYFLNLPDSSNGPPWNAYLFRSNFDFALSINPKRIHYKRTVPYDEIIRKDPYLTGEETGKLKNNKDIIFRFNRITGSLEKD